MLSRSLSKRGALAADSKSKKQLDAWLRECVGAANSRGPHVVDVELRTVGAFGLVGGGDVIEERPASAYCVVRGVSPCDALCLSRSHFKKCLSSKAIEQFTRCCLKTPTDEELRERLKRKKLEDEAEKKRWAETVPEGFQIDVAPPVGGAEAAVERALRRTYRERCKSKNGDARGVSSDTASSSDDSSDDDEASSSEEDETSTDAPDDAVLHAPMMPIRAAAAAAARGARNDAGVAAAGGGARANVGWPMQRGVFRGSAGEEVGRRGGYTPSGAKRSADRARREAHEMNAAMYGRCVPPPSPPRDVGLRAAARRNDLEATAGLDTVRELDAFASLVRGIRAHGDAARRREREEEELRAIKSRLTRKTAWRKGAIAGGGAMQASSVAGATLFDVAKARPTHWFPYDRVHTSTPFNSASDAFQLHPDVALNYGTTLRARWRRASPPRARRRTEARCRPRPCASRRTPSRPRSCCTIRRRRTSCTRTSGRAAPRAGGGGRERRRRDDASATAAAAAGSWRSRPRTASACTSR